jgi:hypothetical protein
VPEISQRFQVLTRETIQTERDDMSFSLLAPQENPEVAAERDFFADYESLTGESPLVFDSFDDALNALDALEVS